jgi:hypothetical protein
MAEPKLIGTEAVEIERMQQAQEFMANPLFLEMFREVERGILEQMADATDEQAVLQLKRRLTGVVDARLVCTYWVATGKHAEARILAVQKFKEAAGRVKRKLDRFMFSKN